MSIILEDHNSLSIRPRVLPLDGLLGLGVLLVIGLPIPAFLLSLGLAASSYRYVEQPVINYSHRLSYQ